MCVCVCVCVRACVHIHVYIACGKKLLHYVTGTTKENHHGITCKVQRACTDRVDVAVGGVHAASAPSSAPSRTTLLTPENTMEGARSELECRGKSPALSDTVPPPDEEHAVTAAAIAAPGRTREEV